VRPEEILARRLAREIQAELAELHRLGEEYRRAPQACDSFSLRARASLVHDLYTGAERIFGRSAAELNGGLPRGDQWHRQLLEDMALDLPQVRPAVISRELAADLGPFLRFRHVFRNAYGFVLDAARMQPLEQQFHPVLSRLTEELQQFCAWLMGSRSA